MLSNVKPYVSPHVSVLIIDIQAVEEHTRLKKNGLLQDKNEDISAAIFFFFFS